MLQQSEVVIHDKLGEGVRLLMPQGIIGFHELKHYCFNPINNGDQPGVFWLLQSHEYEKIAFILLESNALKDRVEVGLKDLSTMAERYGIQVEACELFYVTTIDRSDSANKKVTVNLRAPVVIDFGQQQAWQVILPDSKYEINYAL